MDLLVAPASLRCPDCQEELIIATKNDNRILYAHSEKNFSARKGGLCPNNGKGFIVPITTVSASAV
jgi:hypothetical protein